MSSTSISFFTCHKASGKAQLKLMTFKGHLQVIPDRNHCKRVNTCFANLWQNRDRKLSKLLGHNYSSVVLRKSGHLDLDSLSCSSPQILFSSVRVDGVCEWTAIFRSLHNCSLGFTSGFGWATPDSQRLVSHPLQYYPGCLLQVTSALT